MSSLRNFAIAFLIAIFAWSGVAYYSVGIVATLFEPKDASDLSSEEKREVEHFDGEIGDSISDALKSGRSFTVLAVGTDHDPQIETESVSAGALVVPQRVEATAICLVHFDKEKRAMQFCAVPPSTLVTVDYVEMELGKAYSFKGAGFVRDTVSSITGLAVDYLFEFSGRQFVKNAPKTPYTAPLSTVIPPYKGLAGASFEKGQLLSGDSLYAYLHYDALSPFYNRADVLNDIFRQTLVKFAASIDAEDYYDKIKAFSVNMTYNDTEELFEVLTTLPLLIDSAEHKTTLTNLDLYKCGTFVGSSFRVDRDKVEKLFKPYKFQNDK